MISQEMPSDALGDAHDSLQLESSYAICLRLESEANFGAAKGNCHDEHHDHVAFQFCDSAESHLLHLRWSPWTVLAGWLVEGLDSRAAHTPPCWPRWRSVLAAGWRISGSLTWLHQSPEVKYRQRQRRHLVLEVCRIKYPSPMCFVRDEFQPVREEQVRNTSFLGWC